MSFPAFLARFAPVVVHCAAAAWLAFPAPALAQQGPITEAVTQAPAEIDLALVVDRAAQWRREPLGDALWALASGVFKTGESSRAWETLSRQLGMSEEQAFDALLGNRAMFVRQAGHDADPGTWAVLSVVDRATEDALRERLKPAPRKFERGLTVMTLEDGRFLLVVLRMEGQSLLLLGPAASPAMFDRMAPALGRPGAGGLARLPIIDDLRAVDRKGDPGTPRALLLARLVPGEEEWVGFLASARGRELHTDVAVRSRRLVEGPGVEPWSREAFDELQRGAYLACMEWTAPTAERWTALAALTSDLPFLARPFERPDLLGLRVGIFVRPADDALASVALAMETSDAQALAAAGDRLIAGVLESVWPRQPEDVRAALDLGGAFPRAVREVDLSQRLGVLLPAIFDRGPTLAWVYGPGESVRDGGGWWVVGLDRGATEHTCERLTRGRQPGQRPAPWLTLGVVRPSEFLAELRRRGLDVPAPAAPLARALSYVDVFSWELYRAADASARGTLVLRVLERPAGGK